VTGSSCFSSLRMLTSGPACATGADGSSRARLPEADPRHGGARRLAHLHRRSRRRPPENACQGRRLKAEHGSTSSSSTTSSDAGPRRFENRVTELASISRGLQRLAKELAVPVVVLSQLSRAREQPQQRPPLSDSGSRAPSSRTRRRRHDLPRRHVRGDGRETRAWPKLIVAKQRNGPTGTVRLAFIGSSRASRTRARISAVIRQTVAHVDLGALAHNARAILAFLASQRGDAAPALVAWSRPTPTARRCEAARALVDAGAACSPAQTSKKPSPAARGAHGPIWSSAPSAGRFGRHLRVRPHTDALDADSGAQAAGRRAPPRRPLRYHLGSTPA